MQKRVNITYAAIYPKHIFGLRCQHQVLEIMRPWTVRIPFPYGLTW